jgi:hypothetical protein
VTRGFVFLAARSIAYGGTLVIAIPGGALAAG